MMPSWLRKKVLLSADIAALELHLNAIDGLDKPKYPDKLTDECNEAINTLIYLTRAATTIMALHLSELEEAGGKRASEVLAAFHCKLYPPSPTEEGLELVNEVKALMEEVLALRTMPVNKSDTNAKFIQQVESWSEIWLEHLPHSDLIVKSIGKLAVFMMGSRIIADANSIDTMVADVLYRAR
jgi:hypothetical protein